MVHRVGKSNEVIQVHVDGILYYTHRMMYSSLYCALVKLEIYILILYRKGYCIAMTTPRYGLIVNLNFNRKMIPFFMKHCVNGEN